MEQVSELHLPYLPATGYSPLQFQMWWQDVVDRLMSAVTNLNLAVDAAIALEERDAALSAQADGLASRARRLSDGIQDGELATAALGAQVAALGASVNAMRGLGDMLAQQMSENAELRGRIDRLRLKDGENEVIAWLL